MATFLRSMELVANTVAAAGIVVGVWQLGESIADSVRVDNAQRVVAKFYVPDQSIAPEASKAQNVVEVAGHNGDTHFDWGVASFALSAAALAGRVGLNQLIIRANPMSRPKHP